MASTTVSAPASAPLFCNACRFTVLGDDPASRSGHYSSQWHRYNVKRKCALLAPLTAAEFAIVSAETPVLTCCNRQFRTEASLLTHQQSKKHKKATAIDDDFILVDPSPSSPIPIGSCLFCDETFDDLTMSLEHMTKLHGFFVPYKEYLVDLEGLLVYFGCKVGVGHVCVYCNATFRSLVAVQSHMSDLSHCKMRWEPEANDDDDNEDEKEYVFDSNNGFEFDEFYDFDDEMAVDTQSTDGSVVVAPSKTKIEHINDMGELEISNGNIIGHRDYKLIYRQRAVPPTSMDSTRNNVAVMKLIGSAEMAQLTSDVVKRGQRIDRLRQRQQFRFQCRSHKLAAFFKEQNPI